MSGIWRGVKTAWRKYPKVANCLVYGSLYTTAEFSQQTIIKKYFPKKEGKEPESYDWETLKRYGLLGTLVLPNIMNVFYGWLDTRFIGTGARMVFQKMVLDQCILTPILLVSFFTAMSYMEGKEDLTEELRNKIVPTFATSCLFWLPAQAVNFRVVPAAFRIVYMGFATFFWANILCYIKRKSK